MATSVDQAKREQPAAFTKGAAVAPSTPRTTTLTAGVTAQDYLNADRIHVKDGSLFIDPYLVIHPKELAPENDAKLRNKLRLTYTINNPSFFESSTRTAIALNLGQLIPISAGARRSKLMDEVTAFNTQVDTGIDQNLQRELTDKQAPFSSIVRSVTEQPETDPVGLELLKNGLGVYLLVREKLTQNGCIKKLTEYVQRAGSPDQVLADLSRYTGITPIAMREAALKGGLDGVGQLLGLDPKYVSDVKQLTEYAATQDFSYNLVEHWHLGRQLQGLQAPLKEKITTGLDARITAKIAEYRDRIHNHFDVPAPVKDEERRVAEALDLVEPIQRELFFRLGGEVCYSPEINADDIAFYPGIYGLNRKAANDLRDIQGTYRIYFSGRGDLKGSMRTLVHEFAHVLWPEQFSPAEAAKIDQLAASDQKRFTQFNALMRDHFGEFEKLFNAYKAGDPQEQAAIIATTDQRFAQYDFHAAGLFPYLREAHDFQYAVKHAYDTLSIEGERYNRSGYHSPQERFREVISRFAELKQVEYAGEPQFLQFLSPGLNQVWEDHYLPHLVRVNEKVKSGARTAAPLSVQKDAEELSSLAVNTQGQLVDTAPTPKVEERPVEPTPAPAAGQTHASTLDSAPMTNVNAASIQLNPNTLSALNTLHGMGIVQH